MIPTADLKGTVRRPLTHRDRMRCASPCRGDIIPAHHIHPAASECRNGHVWRYLRSGWELRGEDGVWRTEAMRKAVQA